MVGEVFKLSFQMMLVFHFQAIDRNLLLCDLFAGIRVVFQALFVVEIQLVSILMNK